MGPGRVFRKERRSKIKTFFDLHDLRFFQGPHSSVLAFRLDQPIALFHCRPIPQKKRGCLSCNELTAFLFARCWPPSWYRLSGLAPERNPCVSFLLVAVGCFLFLVLLFVGQVGQREVSQIETIGDQSCRFDSFHDDRPVGRYGRSFHLRIHSGQPPVRGAFSIVLLLASSMYLCIRIHASA